MVAYDLRSSRAVAEYIEEKGGSPMRERVGTLASSRRRCASTTASSAASWRATTTSATPTPPTTPCWRPSRSSTCCGRPASRSPSWSQPLLRYAKSEEINFQVEDKQGKIDLLADSYSDGEIDYLDGITVQYDDWWFNVRPSNTEPYLRLVCEAKEQAMLDAKMAELVALLGEPV